MKFPLAHLPIYIQLTTHYTNYSTVNGRGSFEHSMARVRAGIPSGPVFSGFVCYYGVEAIEEFLFNVAFVDKGEWVA